VYNLGIPQGVRDVPNLGIPQGGEMSLTWVYLRVYDPQSSPLSPTRFTVGQEGNPSGKREKLGTERGVAQERFTPARRIIPVSLWGVILAVLVRDYSLWRDSLPLCSSVIPGM